MIRTYNPNDEGVLYIFAALAGLAILVITALVLSGIVYTHYNAGTLCDCPVNTTSNEVIENIILNGNELFVAGMNLSINGTSGIKVSAPDNTTILVDNLRDLSPYVVSAKGDSEYLTPQEAYNAVIRDDVTDAVILILPGIYEFGEDDFLIDLAPISFVAVNPSPSGGNGVIFAPNGSRAGITINTELDNNFSQLVSFRGISFGLPNDDTEFTITVTDGEVSFQEISIVNCNTAFVFGNENTSGVFITFFDSIVRPLAMRDFVKTMSNGVIINLRSTYIVQLDFSSLEVASIIDNLMTGGMPTSIYKIKPIWHMNTGSSELLEPDDITISNNGFYAFNLYGGYTQVIIFDFFAIVSTYIGIFKGPAPGIGGGQNIQVKNAIFTSINDHVPTHFIAQSGSFSAILQGVQIQLTGELVNIYENCSSSDSHRIDVVNSAIITGNATFYSNGSIVTTIGQNYYELYNTFIFVANKQLMIDMIVADPMTDNIRVEMSGITLRTNGPTNSSFAEGPSPLIASINIGGSSCINGANTVNGFDRLSMTQL